VAIDLFFFLRGMDEAILQHQNFLSR